jgi:phage tail sheath protein FI
VYFPRTFVPDQVNGNRLRSIATSGTVAGLFARTDATRGVWKAPAGTEARLENVQALAYVLTDLQNGALNPLGVNCLRTFPIYSHICWGARTLDGADQLASEWKYIPIRRLALFIEESLFRGTKWVVFEPNDELGGRSASTSVCHERAVPPGRVQNARRRKPPSSATRKRPHRPIAIALSTSRSASHPETRRVRGHRSSSF